MLNHEIGLPLSSSARVADTVLAPGFDLGRIRVRASLDGAASLVIDLERFHSTANARLASAFSFASPRKRGRPPRTKPAPVSPSVPPTRVRVTDDVERLALLAEQLRQGDARPRGIERDLPFIMDVATLRAVRRLPLTTREGDVDVMVLGAARTAQSAPGGGSKGR